MSERAVEDVGRLTVEFLCAVALGGGGRQCIADPKHVGICVLVFRAEIVVEFVNVLVLGVAFVGHVHGGESVQG